MCKTIFSRRHTRSRHARRRSWTAVLAAVVAGLIWAAAASADAPDPVDVAGKASPGIDQPVTSVALTPRLGYPSAVTLTVKGGWLWSTHRKDCNADRAGVGFAVDWNDPKQPGNPIKVITFTENAQTVVEDVRVGTETKNDLNPQDNVVHPTPSSGTGTETDIQTPAQYQQWRGGCGNPGTGTASGVDQTKLSRGVWGPRQQFFQGTTFGAPDRDGRNDQRGRHLAHVRQRGRPPPRICAITYDVHPGTNAADNNGVGIPKRGDVIAGGQGHNGDNGAEENTAWLLKTGAQHPVDQDDGVLRAHAVGRHGDHQGHGDAVRCQAGSGRQGRLHGVRAERPNVLRKPGLGHSQGRWARSDQQHREPRVRLGRHRCHSAG